MMKKENRMRTRPARGCTYRCLFAVTLALVSAFGWGQEASPSHVSPADLAPFASRLKAEAVDYQVKLTWRDAPDLKGVYLVYRAAEEITPGSFARAVLVGMTNSGIELFLDSPPDLGGYYYAVLLRDTAGTLYPILIPFRNKTTTAVSVQTTSPEQALASRITGIKAAVSASSDGVEVTFTSSSPARDLLLFWGTAPLASPDDLLRSASATELDPGTTRYVQPALPGIDYWFAVMDAGLYKLGQATVAPGVNATTIPVRMPINPARLSTMSGGAGRRNTPLPSLSMPFGDLNGQQSGDSGIVQTPPEKQLSAAATRTIGLLMQGIARPPAAERSPEIFPSDISPVPGTELSQLQQIVTGPFAGSDMAGAQKQLSSFLAMRRAPEVDAHARFYLGQAYYFLGQPRDALMEFLIAEDSYFQRAQPWKDACFQKLEAEER
jgi:hypothetical protein